MTANEIEQIFREAGVPIPDHIREYFQGKTRKLYDDSQSWCCGLEAKRVGEDVLVKTYCLRHRLNETLKWLCRSDGSWEKLKPLPESLRDIQEEY